MLEIACFELTSAEVALISFADRIEFCSAIEFGGLTPNIYDFEYLKKNYTLPIYVMIRPVGESFLYTDSEYRQMKQEILDFKNAGADGFVFGILDEHNEVDTPKNAELISLVEGFPCTFHRAVDRTPDIFSSVSQLINLGFSTVLTSGGASSAMEGAETLAQLIYKFGKDIEILVGGGVRSENIQELKAITHATSFHSSAIRKYEHFANAEEIKLLKAGI